MKKIYVIGKNCNGCGKCKKVCGYSAIQIIDRKAVINVKNCTFCNACLKVCENEAIVIPEKKIDFNTNSYNETWTFIEYSNGVINPLSLQILCKGYELSRKTGNKLTAVIIGQKFDNVKIIKKTLADCGAQKIKMLQSKRIINYHPEDVAEILAKEITTKKPNIVLFLGTSFGRELAPRVAAKVRTGITADCTDLYIDDEKNLVQVRPTYGGRILATIVCRSRPQMASVRPNIFDIKIQKKVNLENVKIEKIKIEVDTIEEIKKVINVVQRINKNLLIDDAEIVICGGFGMGSKKSFKQLEILASKLGGAVGGTRAVVDEGWIEFSRQIGQTGKIIRPRLYISFGVSGAIHHLIGMKNARKIIAINKDARAPIFKIADIGVIGDIHDILPKLIERL